MPDNFTGPADTRLIRRVPRSQVIAAIHAFADFLATHPELPAPTALASDSIITDMRPGETKAEAADRWFEEHQAQRVYHGETGSMATIVIASAEAHGITIDYRAHAIHDHARPL